MGSRLCALQLVAVLALAGCASAGETPPVTPTQSPPATAAAPPATLSPTASPVAAATTAPTKQPKPTSTPTPTPEPKAWTASYRSRVCSALDRLYDITPHLDAAGALAGQGDVSGTRAQVFEVMSLSLEATGELVGLPAWPPGNTLVGYLRSAADDLGAGAATFIDGLDAGDSERMSSGALQMDRGGSTVGSAQSEMDRLSAEFGGGC